MINKYQNPKIKNRNQYHSYPNSPPFLFPTLSICHLHFQPWEIDNKKNAGKNRQKSRYHVSFSLTTVMLDEELVLFPSTYHDYGEHTKVMFGLWSIFLVSAFEYSCNIVVIWFHQPIMTVCSWIRYLFLLFFFFSLRILVFD